MSAVRPDNQTVPADIEAALRRLIRRARVVIVARGLCAVVAVAMLALLAVMATDAAFVIFSAYPRWLMSLAALAVTLLAAGVGLVRPLARSFSLTGAARAIEHRHPELHERISSAVELTGSTDEPEIRGSGALIAELVRAAAEDATALQPKCEITFGRAKPYAIAAAAAAAVLGMLLIGWPAGAGRLLHRAVAPHRDLGNAPAVDLEVIPGATVLRQGERLTVNVAATGREVDSAELRLRRGGEDEILRMTRIAPGRFELTLPRVTTDLAYRIHAEGALTEYYAVTVVPVPAVASIEVAYERPDYIGVDRPPSGAEGTGGSLHALRHTVAAITMRTNRPMAEVSVAVNNVSLDTVTVDGAVCRFRIPMTVDGEWRVGLSDEYGFRNVPRSYPITVVSDAVPKVAIRRPEANLQVRPDDRVQVSFALADDFGLLDAELQLEADGRKLPPVPLAVAADGTVVIDLAAMPTAGVAEVAYRICAWDNLPATLGGPQVGRSARHTLDLRADAVDYATQSRLAIELRIREALETALTELRAAKKLSEPIRRTMPNLPALDKPTVEKINLCRQHLTGADEAIRRLVDATVVSEHAALADALSRLLDGDIARALQLLNMIKLTDATALRADQADEADFAVDAAIAELAGLLSKLGAMVELMHRAATLEGLAARQVELASAASAAEPASQDSQPQPSDSSAEPTATTDPPGGTAQDRLADDIGRFVRQTPGAQRQQLHRDAKGTANLAAIARQLQQRQQALAAESDRVAQISQIDDRRAELSARQYQVARTAGVLAKRLAALGGPATAAAAVGDLAKQTGDRLMARPSGERHPRPRAGKSTLPPIENGRYGQADVAAQKQLEEAIRRISPAIDRQLRQADPGEKSKPLGEMRTEFSTLLGTQRNVSRRVGDLARRRGDLFGQLLRTQVDVLRDQQKQLAADARVAVAGLRKLVPQDDRAGTAGARAAANVEQAIGRNNLEEAAAQAAAAAGRFKAVATRLGVPGVRLKDDSSPRPTVPPLAEADRLNETDMLGRRITSLADRQGRVAGSLRHLVGGELAGALVARQHDLRAATGELGSNIRLLAYHASDLVNDSEAMTLLDQADDAIVEAVACQGKAAGLAGAHRAAQAAGAQRHAAELLGKVAESLGRLGRRLTDAGRRAPPIPNGKAVDRDLPGRLAEAYDAAAAAARQDEADAARRAARLLAALAARARGQMVAMGLRPRPNDSDSGTGTGTTGTTGQPGQSGQAAAELSPVELARLGIDPSDWAKLPVALRSRVLQVIGDDRAGEYRPLIKQYFQEVARRAVARQTRREGDAP